MRARQLNAQDFVKRQEERIQRIVIEENNNKKKYDSVLPIEFVEEFESRYLRTGDSETRKGRRKTSHARSKWNAAKKMIGALKIAPSEWYYYNKEVYDYFHEQQLSISYTISILSLVNAWGYFICRKLAKPFLPVTRPRGYERQRLLDRFKFICEVDRLSLELRGVGVSARGFFRGLFTHNAFLRSEVMRLVHCPIY